MAVKPRAEETAPKSTIAEPSVDLDDGSLSADAAIAQREETLDEAIERIRVLRNRTPFGSAMAQKLALPKRSGYHTHWFNDVGGRIDEASASGWAHRINPRDGKPFKRVVGSGRDGNALVAYAMDLPEIFWLEEMDLRHQDAKSRIDAIKAKPFQAQPGQVKAADQGKFYSPVEAPPLQVVKS